MKQRSRFSRPEMKIESLISHSSRTTLALLSHYSRITLTQCLRARRFVAHQEKGVKVKGREGKEQGCTPMLVRNNFSRSLHPPFAPRKNNIWKAAENGIVTAERNKA